MMNIFCKQNNSNNPSVITELCLDKEKLQYLFVNLGIKAFNLFSSCFGMESSFVENKNTETNALQLEQSSTMYNETVHVEGTTVHGAAPDIKERQQPMLNTKDMQQTDTVKDNAASLKDTESKNVLEFVSSGDLHQN